tara:strand:+ start:112925 stop:113440 length:516 start_codon:yes stop_codon:yes gene_type:complete
MRNKSQILKATNHRWFSAFFLGGAALAFFMIEPEKSLFLKYGVVCLSLLIGIWFLLRKSEDKIWISNGIFHFSQVRGKEAKADNVPIKDIRSFEIVFSGHHGGNSIVRHNCYVVTKDGKRIKLPDGIKYAAYNPGQVGLSFLVRPLQVINRNIFVDVNDEEVKGKAKPVFK